jgi:hypothetical protein
VSLHGPPRSSSSSSSGGGGGGGDGGKLANIRKRFHIKLLTGFHVYTFTIFFLGGRKILTWDFRFI